MVDESTKSEKPRSKRGPNSAKLLELEAHIGFLQRDLVEMRKAAPLHWTVSIAALAIAVLHIIAWFSERSGQ